MIQAYLEKVYQAAIKRLSYPLRTKVFEFCFLSLDRISRKNIFHKCGYNGSPITAMQGKQILQNALENSKCFLNSAFLVLSIFCVGALQNANVT